MRDFIVFRAPPVDRAAAHDIEARVRALSGQGFEQLLNWRGISVLARHDARECAPLLLPQGLGVVFGAVFERDAQGRRIAEIDEDAAWRWVSSGGARLVETCWGPFAAFLLDRGRDELHVAPAPMGALPLWTAQIGAATAIFSEPSVFAAAGGAIDADSDELAAFLIYPNRFTRAGALKGLVRIFPGERASFGRDQCRTSMIWSPPRSRPEGERPQLREALLQSCGALASWRGRVLHRLSGGFDSSAVLGALRASAPDAEIVCVNEYSRVAPEGDERHFARAAAAHADATLIELEMRPEHVLYERMLAAPLSAAPSMAMFSWANRSFEEATAQYAGAIATSGSGGDHVFYRGRSVMAAADAWADGAPFAEILRQMLFAARRSGRPFWSMLAQTLRHGALGLSYDHVGHFRRGTQSRREARQTARQHQAHPWLSQRASLSGERERMLHLLDTQTYFQCSALRAHFAFAPPILFEPVVEACCSTPTYVLCANGIERGLARQAFADFVPDCIRLRRTKAHTTRFFTSVLDRNRAWLEALMSESLLAELGLLSREEVLGALRANTGARSINPGVLLPIVAAEHWLRNVRALAGAAQGVGAKQGFTAEDVS